MAQTSAGEGVSRFTDLPGEQRNSIYRHLFDDITTSDKPFHVWKELEGLPRYKELATYTSLLLASHQLKIEASSIFEHDYLPHLTFYYDSLSELRKLTDPAIDNNLKHSGAHFLLGPPTAKGLGAHTESMHLMFGTGLKVTADIHKAQTHDNVFYDTSELRVPSPSHTGVYFRRRYNGRTRTAIIIQGPFHSIGWKWPDRSDKLQGSVSEALLASVIADTDEYWRLMRTQQGPARSLTLMVDDAHSTPPLEELW